MNLRLRNSCSKPLCCRTIHTDFCVFWKAIFWITKYKTCIYKTKQDNTKTLLIFSCTYIQKQSTGLREYLWWMIFGIPASLFTVIHTGIRWETVSFADTRNKFVTGCSLDMLWNLYKLEREKKKLYEVEHFFYIS